jgi:phosphoribosylamine--glycine ligase
MPAYLTYIPEDAEDMIRYFDYLKKELTGESIEFELQAYVEGIAVSTEAWCDGTRFVPPYNHTIEKKKFANDDLGPGTGCSGNVVWTEPNVCRVVRDGIGRAEAVVTQSGYIGAIDLNTIVNDEGVWGLEWTPRFGYDAISTFLRLYTGDLGKMLSDFSRSQWPLEERLPVTEGRFAGSLRLTIPPAPDEQHPIGPGTPLRGFTHDVLDSCYFYEVMVDHRGNFAHSGGFGTVASLTGVALSPRESLERPYTIAEKVKVPNKHYRTDLREVFEKMFGEFAALGG